MKKNPLYFRGVIRDLKYDPRFQLRPLPRVDFADYDVNAQLPACVLDFDNEVRFGLSKWVSPKPSRTYPSERIYKTYHMGKRVTIIPILKDEGAGTQNNDRLNFMTLSRMNLMNVFIILAWYDDAKLKPGRENRITNQRLNAAYVRERLLEVKQYQQTALHWNTMHFERDYECLFRTAVKRYLELGSGCGAKMHSAENHLAILESYLVDGKFSIEAFAKSSSRRTAAAAKREMLTVHELEYLATGQKAYMELENMLGGEYHMTVDEVYWEVDKLVLQESKNTRHSLPSEGDIADGLFKLIFLQNIHSLTLDGTSVPFTSRLRLTGKLTGSLKLPAEESDIIAFCQVNNFQKVRRSISKQDMLMKLNEELRINDRSSIVIAGNK